jgi:hypothetical protein
MGASANGGHGAPIKAADEAKTEAREKNARSRTYTLFLHVAQALRFFRRVPDRRLRALRWAFSAVQRVCARR